MLPQSLFRGPEFLKLEHEKLTVFETAPAIPSEVGIEKLRCSLTVNALSMTKSKEFGILNNIDCKRFGNLKKMLTESFLVLRFVRNMKCILTEKENVHVIAREKFCVRVVYCSTVYCSKQ